MTAPTPSSAIDAASSAPSVAARLAANERSGRLVGALLEEMTASWQPATIVAERRTEHREPCDLPAVLAPLDGQGQPLAGLPLVVQVKDLSKHGIGIVHTEPMPHRLVFLAYETPENDVVRLVVRLKWCRFKHAGAYESGGQIVRKLKPGEGPCQPNASPAEPTGEQHVL